jgi:hypothetical protein
MKRIKPPFDLAYVEDENAKNRRNASVHDD